ncbi:hypothetical protein QR680_011990 [Steinernema hermaphroditum]|uniref:Uncharacterized protein n=1 Tax=Steinernema hermaphroditum TaxID=289476 RepID=A0AA39I353_9BILA|nr:hypothetical protein QR680_011990 [Steinernema hermaphroditum]
MIFDIITAAGNSTATESTGGNGEVPSQTIGSSVDRLRRLDSDACLVLGFALDEGDVADLTRKMEGLLAGTEVKPTAKTILDLCSGNELSCLKAIIPAMREKQKGRMAIGAAVDAAEAALSSE